MLAPSSSNRGAGTRGIFPRRESLSLTGMDSDRFDAAVYARRLASGGRRDGDAGLTGLVITPGYDCDISPARARNLRAAHRAGVAASVMPRRVRGSSWLRSRGRRSLRLGLTVRTGRRRRSLPVVCAALVAPCGDGRHGSMPALAPFASGRCTGGAAVLATDRAAQAADGQGRVRDSTRCASRLGHRPVHAECRSFDSGPHEADVAATSPKPLLPRAIRRWPFIIVAPVRTAPIRTTVIPTANCRPVTSSSSTSEARTSPVPFRLYAHLQHWRTRTRCGPTVFGTATSPAGSPGSGPSRGDGRAGRCRCPGCAGRAGLAEFFVHRTDMASGCQFTKSPTSSPGMTCRWPRAWRFPSSRYLTSRAVGVPESKTCHRDRGRRAERQQPAARTDLCPCLVLVIIANRVARRPLRDRHRRVRPVSGTGQRAAAPAVGEQSVSCKALGVAGGDVGHGAQRLAAHHVVVRMMAFVDRFRIRDFSTEADRAVTFALGSRPKPASGGR